jgi:hypothetical protein
MEALDAEFLTSLSTASPTPAFDPVGVTNLIGINAATGRTATRTAASSLPSRESGSAIVPSTLTRIRCHWL